MMAAECTDDGKPCARSVDVHMPAKPRSMHN